jgi:hypothetical protein
VRAPDGGGLSAFMPTEQAASHVQAASIVEQVALDLALPAGARRPPGGNRRCRICSSILERPLPSLALGSGGEGVTRLAGLSEHARVWKGRQMVGSRGTPGGGASIPTEDRAREPRRP